MGRTFDEDLKWELRDPESAALFAKAQIESAKELLKGHIISSLIIASMEMNQTKKIKWEINCG